MKTTAWHLRQDGKSFPVKFHLYSMHDDDLSSEAEIASFLIVSNSQDQELAEFVIDAWAALLIYEDIDTLSEDIDTMLTQAVSSYMNDIPFVYPLTTDQILEIHHKLNNYSDVVSLYDFVSSIKKKLQLIWKQLSESFNQQFCRVRYGGEYDTESNNNEIWFRISSVAYNWSNTIYLWMSEHKRTIPVDYITICRDEEADRAYRGKQPKLFYTAKDGTSYHHMLLSDFLSCVHESNPVFSSTSSPICPANLNRGVITHVRNCLNSGSTLNGILKSLGIHDCPRTPVGHWSYYLESELEDLSSE